MLWIIFKLFLAVIALLLVYAWFKQITGGRMLWLRNVLSTLPALAIDSVLFITIAFWGTATPLLLLIKGQIVIKWAVGIINIPFMYLNRRILEGPR